MNFLIPRLMGFKVGIFRISPIGNSLSANCRFYEKFHIIHKSTIDTIDQVIPMEKNVLNNWGPFLVWCPRNYSDKGEESRPRSDAAPDQQFSLLDYRLFS